MNILWLSWKDANHPLAGGAEVISTQLRNHLIKDGSNVVLITAKYKGSTDYEIINGVKIYRTGGKYSVYLKARALYKNKLQDWPDLIIDEMNTIPFIGYKYDKNISCMLHTYQLARGVWFYQMPFPFSLIGYLAEPLYLRLIANKYSIITTESNSTKKDLVKHGFKADKIHTFRVGMSTPPKKYITKKSGHKIIFLGSVRPMKRTLHAIKAFEIAKSTNPDLSIDVVGDYSGKYGKKVFNYVKKSRFSASIIMHGKVTDEVKTKIINNSSLIIITSVKEGWGLIATEAAAYGVPAVAYDVDGLRDSVIDSETGLLARPGDINDLAEKINKALNDRNRLEIMGQRALENSRQYTFNNCFKDFKDILTEAKLLK